MGNGAPFPISLYSSLAQMIFTTIHSWQPGVRNGIWARKTKEGTQHIQTAFADESTGRRDGILKMRTHAVKEIIVNQDPNGDTRIDIFTVPFIEQRNWKKRGDSEDVGNLSERNKGPRANDLLAGACIICEHNPCTCEENEQTKKISK